MTRIAFERGALRDIGRISDFLMTHDAEHAEERKDELLGALQVLSYAPEIGRPASAGTRELVLGKAARGYVARYRYLARVNVVLVMAIRHQRESR